MLKEVLLAFREAAYFVWLALKGLCFWRKPPPVTTPEELRGFIESQAKAVTQITLFGYLKTRAGTRWTSLFEDDVFANSISIAILEIYLVATHAVLCGPAIERLKAAPVTKVIVSDTIDATQHKKALPNLKVVSVAPLLAEAIRRVHHSESISTLFI